MVGRKVRRRRISTRAGLVLAGTAAMMFTLLAPLPAAAETLYLQVCTR